MIVAISVVIAEYNESRRIHTALRAALTQRYSAGPVDIIVADSDSIDAASEAVRLLQNEHLGQIHFLFERQSSSSYAARDNSIGQVHGDDVAFADSACLFGPQWPQGGARVLCAPQVAVVAGHVQMV